MKNVGKQEMNGGLSITIEAYLQIVQYLDVEFDLRNGQYRPFRKPNSVPLYINCSSNHPPSVLKQVPDSIARRLSDISSSEEVFKQAAPAYQTALRNSGFDKNLSYSEHDRSQQKSQRNRRRKVLWYNPPFSVNVKTNVGKKFLDLLRLHFHPNHRLHSIFDTKNCGS